MKSGALPAVAATLGLLLCGQCRREHAPPSRAALAAVEPGPAPALAAVAPAPPQPPPAAADPDPDTDRPTPAIGGWLDGTIYRFRLEKIRPCPSTVSGGARVAAVVRVESKINELLVASRDFKLDAGGVILDSAIVQKAPAECGSLLTPKSVRAGKSADGAVVFDLPPGFNPDHQPVRLAYQPTRWGGARRVETVLPSGSLPR